jgi:hypothetical protein
MYCTFYKRGKHEGNCSVNNIRTTAKVKLESGLSRKKNVDHEDERER